MATSPWKDPRIEAPPDGDRVWIKQIFGHPFQANWDFASGTFRAFDVMPNDPPFPWWEVYLWRPL